MQSLKTLRIIHIAILIEALVFFVIVFFVNIDKDLIWMNDENPDLFLIGLILVVTSAMGSFIVPRIMLNSVRSKESREERMKAYLSVAIVRLAFIDAAMTISIVLFFVEKAWIYALMLALLIVVYLGMYPTQNAVERDTELSTGDFSEDEFND